MHIYAPFFLTTVSIGYILIVWSFFMARVVVLDERPASYRVIKHLLGTEHRVDHYEHPTLAADYVREQAPDVIFLNIDSERPGSLDLLGRMRLQDGGAPVVAMMDHPQLRSVVDAVHLGASDVVTHPFRMRDLQLAITRALARRQARPTRGAPAPIPEIAGTSRAIVRVRDDVRRMAGHQGPVVITGESGVGKELVAWALHRLSPAAGGRFEARNCGALPETLVEAELFGTERGAYTDAVTRQGAFELSDGGTLFLDEIGELTRAAQVKLLRVLETGVYQRVGGTVPRRTSARIVAATNRDLRALMVDGRFREDLYYRIDVFRIAIPPLRARREDIPLLAARFLQELSCAGIETRTKCFGRDALERLSAYDWPGNVRELRNVVWRALVDAPGRTICADDLTFG
jgi:DNA-binding NtrC family response regulator